MHISRAAAIAFVLVLCARMPGADTLGPGDAGRLRTVNGYRVLELSGTPERMGEAHGRLLRDDIRRVIGDVLAEKSRPSRYERIIAGAEVMEEYQPDEFRREMKALAKAAGVDYMDIVALQLFGDAERGELPEGRRRGRRGQQCTSYAVFGPATATGECIVGRNFDYWYEEVAGYASIIILYRPEGRRSFVTLSWAGVVNGWTLMNDAGLVAANNNAFSSNESLEGISTCFLQRLIIENASTVEEGVEIARKGPRAVGTVMLIAGGNPPDAVQLEFDSKTLTVRKAVKGWIAAENGFIAHGRRAPREPGRWSRYAIIKRLVEENYGKIDRSMNFAAVRGVPLESMNLHCALMCPSDLTFSVSMGKVPAYRQTFQWFRMTREGIVPAAGK